MRHTTPITTITTTTIITTTNSTTTPTITTTTPTTPIAKAKFDHHDLASRIVEEECHIVIRLQHIGPGSHWGLSAGTEVLSHQRTRKRRGRRRQTCSSTADGFIHNTPLTEPEEGGGQAQSKVERVGADSTGL